MSDPRVPLTTIQNAPAASQGMLQAINDAFGTIPNMFRAVANSSAALASMWGGFSALGGGRLSATLGEQIAVAVAERNGCHYCLAAHTALGRKAGASAETMAQAQLGQSSDPRTAAALGFAIKVVDQRAQVSPNDVAVLRQAGFDDGDIVEILAHVALNLYTNYINVALDVPLDFPAVKLRQAA
jgi:uncharacterized peroxidase-related enzyme